MSGATIPIEWVGAAILAILPLFGYLLVRYENRLASVEDHKHKDVLEHLEIRHAIKLVELEGNRRSDEQDGYISRALSETVTTKTLRRAGIEVDSEPPSNPMMPRPRLPSCGRFGGSE